mgnify:CR=1 FL=1
MSSQISSVIVSKIVFPKNQIADGGKDHKIGRNLTTKFPK